MNNRIKHINAFLFFLSSIISLNAQNIIYGVVSDGETKETIPGVFVFLGNSSIGTSTDIDGSFEFDVNDKTELPVIFSHLNYESTSISQEDLQDTIFLQPKLIELNEVVVTTKAKKKLKVRRLKKFEAALLGAKRDKDLIKLTNPEVLLFDEEKGVITASAEEALIIENKYLGYEIRFFLKRFELSANQDLAYEGDIFFKPLEGTKKENAIYRRNRKKAFLKSSRKFFRDLVKGEWQPELYSVGYSILNPSGEIEKFNEIDFSKLELSNEDENKFELSIGQYFTVVHKDVSSSANAPNANFTMSLSKLKKNADKEKSSIPASFFTSSSDKIIINQYGRIINSREIKEFGHWTENRLDAMLPLDYQLSES